MPIVKVEKESVLYLSDVPLEPEVPEEPAVPVAPEEPLVPLEPEVPEVPEEPFVPDEPDVPDVPEDPSGATVDFFNSPVDVSTTTTLKFVEVVGKSGVNTLPEKPAEPVFAKEPDTDIS